MDKKMLKENQNLMILRASKNVEQLNHSYIGDGTATIQPLWQNSSAVSHKVKHTFHHMTHQSYSLVIVT